MSHFSSLWKARIIEKYRQEYENEKISSLLLSKTEIPQKTMMQKWKFYGRDTKKRFTNRMQKWFPVSSPISNLYFSLKTDQTFPNFVLKSIMGFLGGIVLTYLCFMFFVFQLSISLIHATIMSSIIGILLTLGLAFSYRIRCLVFLLIPQFFSRAGRYTLTCYALVLILTGPATNTLKNSEVLSESMACSQEQIKTNVKQITEAMKNPFNAMKDSIRLMVKKMNKVSEKMNGAAAAIGRMVISLGDVIQSSLSWLNSIVTQCNQKFGRPYEHCIHAINIEVSKYKQTFRKNLFWLHNMSSLAQRSCDTVKSYDAICYAASYATGSFAATLRRKLRLFTERIRTMLHVDVKFHHTYTFSSNGSRSASQVAAGIVTEIRNRADPLITWLSWTSCVTSLFLLLIIFRAKYYQHMFETRSRFDNRYVTKELRELDLKRYLEGRETVLPLHRREQSKYIITTSLHLVASERLYLSRSVVFMAVTTFKLLIHIVADYSLYWVLMTIRYHGRFQTPMPPGPSDAGIQISGSGVVADMIRSLFDAMTTPLRFPTPSPITCLPNPYPPDLQRYTQIAILIVLLWFCALFEPYGLRLRHVIMGHYRPERAKARAVWLYNHILRTRGSFMKLARRKLHREYKCSTNGNLTFRHWIDSHIPFKFLRYILCTLPKKVHCLLCNTEEEYDDPDTRLIKCETPKCPGVYCTSCFSDIGQLCTICISPSDYGDMSDVSLERGSSDESSEDEVTDPGKASDNTKLLKKSETSKCDSWKRSFSKNGNKGKSIVFSTDVSENMKHFKNNILRFKTQTIFNDIFKILLLFGNECSVPQLKNVIFRFLNIIIYNNVNAFSNMKKVGKKIRRRKIILRNSVHRIVSFFLVIHKNGSKFSSTMNSKSDTKILKQLTRALDIKYSKSFYSIKMTSVTMHVSKIKKILKSRNLIENNCKSVKKKCSNRNKTGNSDYSRKLNKNISTKINKNVKTSKNNLNECKSNKKGINLASPSKNTKLSKYIKKQDKLSKSTQKSLICGFNIKKICSICSSYLTRKAVLDITKKLKNYGDKKMYPVMDKTNFKRRKKEVNFDEITQNRANLFTTESRNYRLSNVEIENLFSQYWMKSEKQREDAREMRANALKCLAKLRMRANRRKNEEMKLLQVIKKTLSPVTSKTCRCYLRCFGDTLSDVAKGYVGNSANATCSTENIDITIPYNSSLVQSNPRLTDFSGSTSNAFLKDPNEPINFKIKPRCVSASVSTDTLKTCISNNPAQNILCEGKRKGVRNYLFGNKPNKFSNMYLLDRRNDLPGVNSLSGRTDLYEKEIYQTEYTDRLCARAQMQCCNLPPIKIADDDKNKKCIKRNNGQKCLKTVCFDNKPNVLNIGECDKKINCPKCCKESKKISKEAKKENEKQSIVNCQGCCENKSSEGIFSLKSLKLQNIKLTLSERFIHMRFQNPFPVIKDIYTAFVKLSKTKNDKYEYIKKDTNIPAAPVMCTCATQYSERNKKEKSCNNNICPLKKDASTIPKKTKKRTCAIQSVTTTYKDNFCEVNSAPFKDPGVTIEDCSHETTSSSLSSITKSDGTKSDTICSHMTINNETSPVIRIKKRRRNKVITKNNQSTLTDSAKLFDVSTITSDWWSPLIERKHDKSPLIERKHDKSPLIKRKDEKRHVNKHIEKHQHKHERARKMHYVERSMSTDGRIVKFKSQAQIIPANDVDACDVLSPLRYLLESQKYYNEIFTNKYNSPQGFQSVNKSLVLDKNLHRTHSDETTQRVHESRPRKRGNKYCLALIYECNGTLSKGYIRKFPEYFKFGAASAAYQIEGGWDEDGKGLSIWDVATHNELLLVEDQSNGDHTADSYHFYKRDVEMTKELGLHFYKFSISWPRILPNGFSNDINQLGLDYYNNLINELVKYGVKPFVTMYHWDLPQELQKLGGWTNSAIVDWFVDYARVLFENFGDRVKTWVTINEPKQICHDGYGSYVKAPQINMTGTAEYLCTKNVLLAHAKVYHLYDEHYRKIQMGKIGISISCTWYEPASDSIQDYQAAVDARQFEWGLYTHPIFSADGDYPFEVKHNIKHKSADQGFSKSRLPELTTAEVMLIKDSSEFLGINHYTTRLAYRDASLDGMFPVPSYRDDMGSVFDIDHSWPQSKASFIQEVPWGLFKLLVEIKKLYNDPPIYITGNGWASDIGLLDEDRIRYMRSYLNAMLDAIDEGCDVEMYTVWSLMDSFEWSEGFGLKYGLYQTDMNSVDRTRTPRKSAFIYKEIIRTNQLDSDFEPDQYIVEIGQSSQEKEDKVKEDNEK